MYCYFHFPFTICKRLTQTLGGHLYEICCGVVGHLGKPWKSLRAHDPIPCKDWRPALSHAAAAYRTSQRIIAGRPRRKSGPSSQLMLTHGQASSWESKDVGFSGDHPLNLKQRKKKSHIAVGSILDKRLGIDARWAWCMHGRYRPKKGQLLSLDTQLWFYHWCCDAPKDGGTCIICSPSRGTPSVQALSWKNYIIYGISFFAPWFWIICCFFGVTKRMFFTSLAVFSYYFLKKYKYVKNMYK